MLVFPKYSHHSLTGRLVHHRETSYALLMFMVLGVGLLLGSVTWSGAQAAADGSGSYTVNAVVPPPRPDKPVIITAPASGQVFNTNPVTVEGTCPSGAIVKVYSNGILVGSIICGANGRFSIQVDLVIGTNDLTAVAVNSIDQEGPPGNKVRVTLNEPPGGLGFSTELILQSENYFRGTKPGQEIVWPIEIIGGQAPYAVNVDWGDGTSDLITRLAPGPFTVKHTYEKVGTGYLSSFPLIIRATDAAGHTAFLQLTTIVNAVTGATSSAGNTPNGTVSNVLVLWPLWIVLLLLLVAFWLGEWREKHKLEKRLAALA